MSILIQLHPQVPQCVWTFIVVRDHFRAIYTVHGRIELDMNDVIGAVLPIQMSWSSTGSAVGVGRGQVVLELSEEIGLSKLLWSKVRPLGHGRQRPHIVLIVERQEGKEDGSNHGVQIRNETARGPDFWVAAVGEHQCFRA